MTRRLLLLLPLLLIDPARAQQLEPAKTAELRGQFLKKQQQTNRWSATFTQTVSMPGMKQPFISTGSVAYAAPGHIRLDFTQPAGEYVLAVGDRLFLQKAGKRLSEKSLTGDNAGKPFRSLLNLLQGQLTEEEAIYNATVSRQKTAYSVVLTRKPGARGRGPVRITNTIAADTLEVSEVLVELPNGGTIRFAFEKPQRNHSMPDSLFTTPPAANAPQ